MNKNILRLQMLAGIITEKRYAVLTEEVDVTVDQPPVDVSFSQEDEFEDSVDIVAMDLPLFIRLLEYSREDAQEDADLHVIAQKVNELVKERGVLKMRNYSAIITAIDTELQGQGRV
jgi:hypothetical protein